MLIRFANFLIMFIVGSVGAVAVTIMVADPSFKVPASLIFVVLVVALGMQAIFNGDPGLAMRERLEAWLTVAESRTEYGWTNKEVVALLKKVRGD